MSNPRKIKEIFVELKANLGDLETDQNLLRLASELVVNFKKESENNPIASIAEYKRDLASMDLASAMSDGGWRIMKEESELMKEYYLDSGETECSYRSTYDRLVGLVA